MDAIDPVAIPQMRTELALQTAIAKKMADVQKLQGAEVLKLLEAVAQTGAQTGGAQTGGAQPAGAPQEPGRGEQIDTHA